MSSRAVQKRKRSSSVKAVKRRTGNKAVGQPQRAEHKKKAREKSPTRAALEQAVKNCQRWKFSSGNARKLAEQFHELGMCVVRKGLTDDQVDRAFELVTRTFNRSIQTINLLGLQDQFQHRGFDKFKLRHVGRYDMVIEEFTGSDEFAFLRSEAPWMDVVRGILGDDCKLVHTGCMLSMPGSRTQPLHSDGPHLNYRKHLNPHALNVFVPLIDLAIANGPTEFYPTTHIHKKWSAPIEPVVLTPRAGQCILFDYRIKHRGLSNKSDEPRPLLYFTYGRSDWADKYNFSRRRYLKMPPLVVRKSRAERLAARKERISANAGRTNQTKDDSGTKNENKGSVTID